MFGLQIKRRSPCCHLMLAFQTKRTPPHCHLKFVFQTKCTPPHCHSEASEEPCLSSHRMFMVFSDSILRYEKGKVPRSARNDSVVEELSSNVCISNKTYSPCTVNECLHFIQNVLPPALSTNVCTSYKTYSPQHCHSEASEEPCLSSHRMFMVFSDSILRYEKGKVPRSARNDNVVEGMSSIICISNKTHSPSMS
jgi:hypothetical protein